MKLLVVFVPLGLWGVAPHAGAWIETALDVCNGYRSIVAPHAGAWIETIPARTEQPEKAVAPHAGAWIETGHDCATSLAMGRRAPRGRVD